MKPERLDEIRADHARPYLSLVRAHRHRGELLAEIDRLRREFARVAEDIDAPGYPPQQGWRDYCVSRIRAVLRG